MPEPTLYLFDGYNLLHAGGHADVRELTDELASFVAMKGARGVVVFDGVGEELEVGPLSVRYAPDADTLLERLAADHRHGERVCLVSSDVAVRGTSGPGGAQGRVEHVPARAREPDPRRGRGIAAARPDRSGDPGEARAAAPRAAEAGAVGCAEPGRRLKPVAEPGTNTCSNHSARFAKGL